jgi:hypothetical protein
MNLDPSRQNGWRNETRGRGSPDGRRNLETGQNKSVAGMHHAKSVHARPPHGQSKRKYQMSDSEQQTKAHIGRFRKVPTEGLAPALRGRYPRCSKTFAILLFKNRSAYGCPSQSPKTLLWQASIVDLRLLVVPNGTKCDQKFQALRFLPGGKLHLALLTNSAH